MVTKNNFARLRNRITAWTLPSDRVVQPSMPAAMTHTQVGEARLASTVAVALRLFVLLTLLTGLLYPAAITLVAQLVFPAQANGTLAVVDQRVAGSLLIGQATAAPHYFWPRPSAVDYMTGSDAGAVGTSGATNYGQTNAALVAAIRARAAAFRDANRLPADAAVPADMLMASASGLDPHISPAAARLQVNRVAAARGLPAAAVAAVVEQQIEPPQFGFLGEPRVNVLQLNLALDALQ